METKFDKAIPGQYLTFHLNARPFGVRIETVREINRMGDITPIPSAPSFMAGVMNLRGKVIPVVDLRLKFGLATSEQTRETCIIVIDTQAGLVGTIVDSVSEVVELGQEEVESSPSIREGNSTNWIMGVGKVDNRVILLVDIVNSLSEDNLAQFTKSPGAAA